MTTGKEPVRAVCSPRSPPDAEPDPVWRPPDVKMLELAARHREGWGLRPRRAKSFRSNLTAVADTRRTAPPRRTRHTRPARRGRSAGRRGRARLGGTCRPGPRG